MSIVEEEADECLYWMELLIESGLVSQKRLVDLLEESDAIVAIVVSSIKTARRGKSRCIHATELKVSKLLIPQSAIRNPQSKIGTI